MGHSSGGTEDRGSGRTFGPTAQVFAQILACQLALSLFSAPHARAGNDDGIPIGPEAAQTAAAVTATTEGGAALFYNPAGVAQGEATSLDANLTAYGIRIVRIKDILEGEGRSVGATYVDWVIVPSLVSHAFRLSARWSIALGAAVPRSQDYSLQVDLRTPEGTHWQVLQEERSQELQVGLGAGRKISSRLRVGVSALGVYGSSHLVTSAFAGNQAAPDRSASAFSVEDTREWGLNIRAGVQVRPVDAWSLGLSISAPIVVLARSTKEVGSVFSPGDRSASAGLQVFDRSKDTEATFSLSGAPNLRLGVARHYALGHVALDGTLNFPIDGLPLEGDRKVSWNLRAGLRHFVSEHWNLGGGLFTDRNPLRDAGLDFYGFTLGAGYTQHLLRKTQDTVSVITSLNLRYALGVGSVTGARVPDLASDGPLGFDAVSSRSWVHELAVSFGSGLRF